MEQRMSLITLGVADLAQSRRFYEHGSGRKPSSVSNANITFYQIGSMGLARLTLTMLRYVRLSSLGRSRRGTTCGGPGIIPVIQSQLQPRPHATAVQAPDQGLFFRLIPAFASATKGIPC